jgi:hypothetical protein
MSQQKYLVRVVRPVFEAAYLEVEAPSEEEACGAALGSAYTIPEEDWTGRFNPEDYSFDLHCVRSAETPEGDPFSLLDFPQYSILSTNENPCPVTDGYQPWMDYLNPLSVAAQLSQWIRQLESARGGCYDEGIENLEEILRKWKGTDQKVVPLVPPEHLRNSVDYLESVLSLVRLLNDVD